MPDGCGSGTLYNVRRLTPPPLTAVQKRVVLIVAMLAGVTRLLAWSRSIFDWDEAQFALGVRAFDVARYDPHPPGYPLFIAAAKLVHAAGLAEFRSLQVVVLLGALALFPTLFWLAREAGFGFTTSVCGAAIYVFLPNVWVYGGTAFSDVPTIAVVFAACALLLRGRSDPRAYVAGALLLGVAAGMRTPSLLIGAAPALLATWARLRGRSWVAIALALAGGALIVAGSYAGAALATSSAEAFLDALRIQSKYVRDVDSWRAPGRPPLLTLFRLFFVAPIETPWLRALSYFAALSLAMAVLRRRAAALIVAAMFVPLAVASWLNFDIHAVSRYAISYLPLHALLGADGLRVAGRKRPVQIAAAAVVAIGLAVWTWPAVQLQRSRLSPPAEAFAWVARNVPAGEQVFVHKAFAPHAEFFLPRHETVLWEEHRELPQSGNAWVVDWRVMQGAHNFVYPRNVLWDIVRRRNFEVSIGQVSGLIRYGEGWYEQEGSGAESWRWTAAEAKAVLPPLFAPGRLGMRFVVPAELTGRPPVVEVLVDGVLVGRIERARGETQQTWTVPARTAPSELRIRTSATINPSKLGPSNDTRELGLMVRELTWTPAR
jgi:hypothetical protein